MYAGAVLWDRSSGPRRTVFLVSDRHQIARQSKARPPYIPDTRYRRLLGGRPGHAVAARGPKGCSGLLVTCRIAASRPLLGVCLAKRQIARPLEAEARACRVSTLELFLAQGLPKPRLVVVAEL